ncbi:UNVERIFIED_CONTAM: hypothetical protein GTU68_021677 [Idotea baltica]|nr:hypothetical protein [Idotea baltica]
MYLGIIKMW